MPIDTLCAVNFHPTMYGDISEKKKEYMSRVHYSSIVESLMYVMVCKMLDLAHAVCIVSMFMVKP